MMKMIKGNTCQKWLENIALLAVMQYISFRYLQSTMFDFIYPDIYKYFTFGFLLASGCLRVIYITCKRVKDDKNDEIEKRLEPIKLILIIIIALLFIFVGLKQNYKVLVFFPLVMICLYNINNRKVLRWFVWTVSILLLTTIICSCANIVRNITYIYPGRLIGAYGIINNTDLASYGVFILLYTWCLLEQKGWKNNIIYSILYGIAFFTIYWFTASQTALYCGILLEIAIIWDSIDNTISNKKGKTRRATDKINNLTVFAFPIICILTIVLVALYLNQVPIVVNLDGFLSGRIKVTSRAYAQYGIYPFGLQIEKLHGNGGTLYHYWNQGYSYIDVAYAMLAIRYGWVLLLVIMGIWMFITRKSILSGDKRIALIMAIIAFHAFSEARFLDINYNIILFMPFCRFASINSHRIDERQVQQCPDDKNTHKWFNVVLLRIILCVIILLLLPQIISWLRTVFYIWNWTEGIFAFFGFLFCVLLSLLIVLLFLSLNMLWQKRWKKGMIIILTIVLFASGGLLVCNYTIEKGISDKADQLGSEQDVIHLIQNSASQPIYVAENSEIYQRVFGGFKEHFFSTEELYRYPQGTILTSKNVEALGIINTGGYYCQISQWSGVYTYDPQVVKALKDAGYNCEKMYYTERSCNLTELAIRNELDLDDKGRVVLKGSTYSILENIEYDQWGEYEVRFTIELSDLGDSTFDGQVCTIKIMGEANERIIREQSIDSICFVDGKASFTLSYAVGATPKVSYLIIAEDGVEIMVDEIAWRRVS